MTFAEKPRDETMPSSEPPESLEMVVAFRTHLWNDDVAHMARRMFGYAIGTRFVVLADETNGVLNTAPFEKIAHKSDFSDFGVPNFPPDQVLWYNADYPLYVLRRALPNAACYAMIEFDVAINIDLDQLLRHTVTGGIDLIAHELQNPPDWWGWNHWIGPNRIEPFRRLIPMIVASARAVDAMLARRLALCAEKWPQTPADWPYCEVFIPTAVADEAGFKLDDIKHYAKLPHYTFRDPIHLRDPRANAPGAICHPVLGGKDLLNKLFAQNDIKAIFDHRSLLRAQLAFFDPAEFVEDLAIRMKAASSWNEFVALSHELNWPLGALGHNLAYGKPATQSSVSAFSTDQRPEVDAAGGNNGQITGDFGFHTAEEQDPWWQVDLQQPCLVQKIFIYNRLQMPERCANLFVSASSDAQQWQLHTVKLDKKPFGGADGKPLKLFFTPPFPARHIRITAIGDTVLHLDEVEIYGDS